MPGNPLADKLALVTGGGRGIGAAIAREMAKEGASLVLVARTKEQLKETADRCKSDGAPSVETHPADLTNVQSRDELVSGLLASHNSIDILVNAAGMMPKSGQTPLEGDVEEWSKMLELNLHCPMHLTRLVAPKMVEQKQGLRVIVNIASVAGVEPMKSACAYAASKWGLRGWSLSCYVALREHGIKVVTINPGIVRTKMTEGMGKPERMIQAEDIAEAVMLAVKTKQSCTPVDMTLRPTEPVSS